MTWHAEFASGCQKSIIAQNISNQISKRQYIRYIYKPFLHHRRNKANPKECPPWQNNIYVKLVLPYQPTFLLIHLSVPVRSVGPRRAHGQSESSLVCCVRLHRNERQGLPVRLGGKCFCCVACQALTVALHILRNIWQR